jgi:hypothetical protein
MSEAKATSELAIARGGGESVNHSHLCFGRDSRSHGGRKAS